MGRLPFKNRRQENKKAARKPPDAWEEDRRGIDAFATGILQDIARERPLNDPYAALRLLRQSFVPVRRDVVEIKAARADDSLFAIRFARLKESIEGGLPPLPETVARRCALIADTYLGNNEEFPRRGADVAWHFAVSSSNMIKSRVLAAAVRFMRPTRCLEIGTAYGLSAAIIAFAQQRVVPEGRLLTIEIGEIQHRLSAALLAELFGDRIECCRGATQAVLASAVMRMAPVDFVFHDGGHSGEAYVRDFGNMVDALAPGAVVVFDDIRWQNRFAPGTESRCYEGWREVAAHPRIEAAIEVGTALGMVMLA
ncbi:MAG: class I SAM-dependent methyltransferase [Rhodospirillales bacterium]|nr:class I SAM-dependent methyltransferase [Rhodospirillales bacterium]